MSVYNIDPSKLINKLAEELKGIKEISPPEWAKFVKTGNFKERPPVEKDWWYKRTASLLRKIYVLGPIGVSKLRVKYGGKKNRGFKPEEFRKASGNIIRKSLQQLESSGLIIQKNIKDHKGRVISPKGKSMLDKLANSIRKAK